MWYASRRRLRLAALVIGSTTPDHEYFLHLNTVGRFSHTLPGLFLVCLPLGWLSLWLFDRFGRRGAQRLLPSGWRLLAQPPPSSLLATSSALLLGAASHIAWDAFTHAGGWGVRLLPMLAEAVRIGPLAMPAFKVLQHGSTILGVAVLALVCREWAQRQPPVSHSELWRRAFIPAAVLAAAGILNGARFLSAGFQQFVVAGGVAVTLTLGLGLVAIGLRKPAPQ